MDEELKKFFYKLFREKEGRAWHENTPAEQRSFLETVFPLDDWSESAYRIQRELMDVGDVDRFDLLMIKRIILHLLNDHPNESYKNVICKFINIVNSDRKYMKHPSTKEIEELEIVEKIGKIEEALARFAREPRVVAESMSIDFNKLLKDVREMQSLSFKFCTEGV